MKLFCFIFFFLFSLFSYCQDEDTLEIYNSFDTVTNWTSKYQTDISSIDVIYGNKYYSNNLNGFLPQINKIEIGTQPYFIGVQYCTQLRTKREFSISSPFSLTQMIPVKVKLSDTIDAKISGFNVGIPIVGLDLLHNYKKIDLLFGGGVNIGRLRVYDGKTINKKNPYFSPKLLFMPRIAIGKLVLSAIAEYDFDIFSKRWKNVLFGPKYTSTLSGYRQSGLSIFFCLGFSY